jgi:hypothetical protein
MTSTMQGSVLSDHRATGTGDLEPRSGDRRLAWGVSPRMTGTKKRRSRGAATDTMRLFSHLELPQRICRPLQGLRINKRIAPIPGAHAPGYEYFAPAELFITSFDWRRSADPPSVLSEESLGDG